MHPRVLRSVVKKCINCGKNGGASEQCHAWSGSNTTTSGTLPLPPHRCSPRGIVCRGCCPSLTSNFSLAHAQSTLKSWPVQGISYKTCLVHRSCRELFFFLLSFDLVASLTHHSIMLLKTVEEHIIILYFYCPVSVC